MPNLACHAERTENSGLVLPGEALQGRNIEMVVMVMAEKNGVDRWEVFEANAGVAMTLGSGKGDRADPVRPDGIGEKVEAISLEQDSGVIDERDAEGRIQDTLRGLQPGR